MSCWIWILCPGQWEREGECEEGLVPVGAREFSVSSRSWNSFLLPSRLRQTKYFLAKQLWQWPGRPGQGRDESLHVRSLARKIYTKTMTLLYNLIPPDSDISCSYKQREVKLMLLSHFQPLTPPERERERERDPSCSPTPDLAAQPVSKWGVSLWWIMIHSPLSPLSPSTLAPPCCTIDAQIKCINNRCQSQWSRQRKQFKPVVSLSSSLPLRIQSTESRIKTRKWFVISSAGALTHQLIIQCVGVCLGIFRLTTVTKCFKITDLFLSPFDIQFTSSLSIWLVILSDNWTVPAAGADGEFWLNLVLILIWTRKQRAGEILALLLVFIVISLIV